jgi:endonuclease I
LFADYLEVRRNTGIKAEPVSASAVVYQSTAGELFYLLDSARQTNGYYHIALEGDKTGWVYRTMVRLYQGTIPAPPGSTKPAVADFFGIGQIPSGYYDGAERLSGEALKSKLHKIIRNHKVYKYDELWNLLPETDRDPGNPNNLILLYTKRSQNISQRDRGTTFNYAAHGYTLIDSWNREHVWPKSHGFPNASDTAYTDLHHLRPADRSVNSARNTRSFDHCLDIYFDNAGTVETECYTSSTTWAWEPPDEVKGDIARMMFYMAVRYEGPSYDLELVDYVVPKGNSEPILGKLSTLIEWHKNDPVDNWERQRNHIIYELQGNRNPFIDYPHWVKMIWE